MGFEQAYASLTGLAVANAFGGQIPPLNGETAVLALSTAPWRWTDSTEMACSVVDVLTCFDRVDQEALAERLAARCEHSRGYHPGTTQVLARLRSGESWHQAASGACDGHGASDSGAATRAAPLGAWFCDNLPRALREAELSAAVTHANFEGIDGAVAVSAAAALRGASPGLAGTDLLVRVVPLVSPGSVREGLSVALDLLQTDADPRDAARILGAGQDRSARDSVPLALWIAARHANDFATALWMIARLADDVAAIASIIGGVIAAGTGRPGIPPDWYASTECLPPWLGTYAGT